MITLTSTAATIRLSTGGLDADGCRWRAPVWPDGWEASPARTAVEPKTGADGVVIATSVREARALVLHGTCAAPNEYIAQKARRTLGQICGAMLDANGTLTIVEPGDTVGSVRTFSLTVRYADRLRVEFVGTKWFRFQLPLLAADPNKVET